MIPIARPVMGTEELEAVRSVLDSGRLAQGPRVVALEEAFADLVGVPHAVATSSGTAALHLALLGLGIGPGDEVITVPFTFIATAASVLLVGARPVFIDVRPDDFTMDPALVEAVITSQTRAILPVSLYGQPADMGHLAEIAERYGLAIVEDAAQSPGAGVFGRMSGSWGTGVFSFYASKNMTTGEGGMITTRDTELAGRLRLLRNQGMSVQYRHDVVGYNYRMTDIHAAIGLAQLPKLAAANERRRSIAARYDSELRGVLTPSVRPGVTHAYHQYTIRVRRRDEFVDRLRETGVEAAIYYPIPAHLQKPFVALGYDGLRFPVTERLAGQVVSIPVHPSLNDAEIDTVIDAVNAAAVELGPIDIQASG